MDKTPPQWMIEPLRKYAVFSGRARRAEYWWFVLFGMTVQLFALLIDFGLQHPFGTPGPVRALVSLGLFVPQLAVAVRRLHDIDRTGWWIGGAIISGFLFGALIGIDIVSGSPIGGSVLVIVGVLAAIAYSILVIVWHCTRGTAGPNRFGPDPLALESAIAFT